MKVFNSLVFTSLATLTLAFATPMAYGSMIFDFVCDDPTCGGDPLWGGYFEFTDASVASGFAQGAADILDFSFATSDKGGLEWFLGTYVGGAGHSLANLTIAFDTARALITSIDGGGTCRAPVSGPCVAQNSTGGGDTLFSNALGVLDVNNDFQSGKWVVRAAVPEPTTVLLFGCALAGLGIRSIKRRAMKPF